MGETILTGIARPLVDARSPFWRVDEYTFHAYFASELGSSTDNTKGFVMKQALFAFAATLASFMGLNALADQLSPIHRIAEPASRMDRPAINGYGGGV